MDGILVDMTDGYKTLHASIKIAVISYSAAIARNARAALSDIATTATDLVTVAANSMAQYDAFKQSLDHISRSWNNTANSMTNYMSEVDKKLLVLNHLTSSLKSTRGPPSTDSRYSPDPIVGASLVLVSGSIYKSTMGTLNFATDESIGFVGSNNEGQLLGEFIKALGKPKPIEKVLNKDLNLLIIYLKKNQDFIIAVISYSAAIARNARAALSDIATTATDLVTVAANSMAQYDAFKQSLDHISRSWNNTANSMTNYMSEVDKKLLVLNHLTSSLKSTRGPPSTDSRYSQDPIVGASLVLVSGSIYKSTMGTLNFATDESIGFVGSNNEGQLLGEFIKALGKPKPIEKVLNKDLNLLIIYLKKNQDFIVNYTNANKELRVKMLHTISKSLPNQQNQWIKIDDPFI
ncbi:unnamed protein product [Arctia plantaginis]|uniref:Uncharacterized protein n=1 Tax=Arctia plantaginis TaxID=874455 RepID=A0A8S0ZJJ3_ARCPL|nr:unnamed protein product [Arctia plantaginis]